MRSLIETAREPGYPAEIALVVSNRPDAAGLAFAKSAGIATAIVDHRAQPNRDAFDAALGRALESADVDLVCLAGFMRILTDSFVAKWEGRMLNIHPSLLPLFKGLHPHRQALEAGATEHGCSVHFVTPELDSGPVIAQSKVPVLPDDTEDSLAARVLAEEHRLYPEGLRLVASGAVRLEGGRLVQAAA